MEPRFVKLDETLIVGIEITATASSGEFPKTWEQLSKRVDEIQNKLEPSVSYGVESYDDKELMAKGVFKYTAGFEISNSDRIPDGMTLLRLPKNEYAVFEYTGVIDQRLSHKFAYIYKEWLPKSEYEVAAPFDFERYDHRFKGLKDENSVFDIYLPVKKKS